MALFKKAWERDDEAKALAAIEKLSIKDEILEAACSAPRTCVRLAALERIIRREDVEKIFNRCKNNALREETAIAALQRLKDSEFLVSVILDSSSKLNVRLVALELYCANGDVHELLARIRADTSAQMIDAMLDRVYGGSEELYAEIARTSGNEAVLNRAFARVRSERLLVDISVSGSPEHICQLALDKIKEPSGDTLVFIADCAARVVIQKAAINRMDAETLERYIIKTDKITLARYALEKLKSEDARARVVLQAKNHDIRTAALNKISSKQHLQDIIKKSTWYSIRDAAQKRIYSITKAQEAHALARGRAVQTERARKAKAAQEEYERRARAAREEKQRRAHAEAIERNRPKTGLMTGGSPGNARLHIEVPGGAVMDYYFEIGFTSGYLREGDSKVTFSLPSGAHVIKYVGGKNWIDKNRLFDEILSGKQCTDSIHLAAGDEMTVKLQRVSGGNLGVHTGWA